MKSFALQSYRDAGCTLVPAMGQAAVALWRETDGALCLGCAAYRGGLCIWYRKLTSGRTVFEKQYSETVRDEAARRGISLKQVRRERAEVAN